MQASHDTKSAETLLQWKKYDMLYANPEYQRGAVWTLAQKKLLVDSLLRGYPIPLIYLHHIAREVAGAKHEHFEVIDGQQRINALYEYNEGNSSCLIRLQKRRKPSFPTLSKNSRARGAANDSRSFPLS